MKIFSRLRSAYVLIPFLMVCSMPVSPVLAANSDENKQYWDYSDYEQKLEALRSVFFNSFNNGVPGVNACDTIMRTVRPMLKKAKSTLSYTFSSAPLFKISFDNIVNLLQSFEQSIVINSEDSYTIVKQWHAFLSGAFKAAFFYNGFQHEQFNKYLNAIQAKIQAYTVQLQFDNLRNNVIQINSYLAVINKQDLSKITEVQRKFLVEFPSKQKLFNNDVINDLVKVEDQLVTFKGYAKNVQDRLVRLSQELFLEITSIFPEIRLEEAAIPALDSSKINELKGLSGDNLVKVITNEFKIRIAPLTSEVKAIESLSAGTLGNVVTKAASFMTSVVEALLNNESAMDLNKKKDCLAVVVSCANLLSTIDSKFKNYRDAFEYLISQLVRRIAEVRVTENVIENSEVKSHVQFIMPEENKEETVVNLETVVNSVVTEELVQNKDVKNDEIIESDENVSQEEVCVSKKVEAQDSQEQNPFFIVGQNSVKTPWYKFW